MSKLREVWAEANSWRRGAINPGDTAWVVFVNRHGPDNRIIGRGETELQAIQDARGAPAPQERED